MARNGGLCGILEGMSWEFPELDPGAPLPLHRQIRRAIRAAVSRVCPEERKLPSTAEMAAAFGVNRLTVLKAVRPLVQSGELRSIPGKGVYTGGDASKPGDRDATDVRFFEGIAEGSAPSGVPEVTPAPEAFGRFVAESLSERVISFAAGFPPEDLIPVDGVRRRATRILRGTFGAKSLGYAHGLGDETLRDQIRLLLATRGLNLAERDTILVTSGAQQALALCLASLLDNGAMAVEAPGYMGFIAACRQRGVPLYPVPLDAGGISLKHLAAVLQHPEVRGIYTVPTFQNPTGVTQQLSRRKRVLHLARQREVLVIEDDTYADLRLGGRPVPPIKALPGADRVLYVGSFSKSLSPGLRIGFVAAREALVLKLLHLKETADISTGKLSQALTAAFIEDGGYRRHLSGIRSEYRLRRDAMMDALKRELGGLARVWRPKGGMHLFVMLEAKIDMAALENRCRAAGVLFAPASLFFSDGRRPCAFRLNFAAHNIETIHIGIGRLARCIAEELEK